MFCLRSGTLALIKTDPDENTALIWVTNAGETSEYPSFFAGDVHSTSAKTVINCEVCYIPGHVLKNLVSNNGELGLGFHSHAAGDMREVDETHFRMSTAAVRTRFTYYLKSISENHGNRINVSL